MVKRIPRSLVITTVFVSTLGSCTNDVGRRSIWGPARCYGRREVVSPGHIGADDRVRGLWVYLQGGTHAKRTP